MNNYNMSDSGENIEFSVFYDNYLSQQYYRMFEDDNLRLDFGRDCSLFLIGDYESPYYSKLDLLAKSKKELFNLMLDYDLLSYNANLNDFKKAEYIADLINVTHKRHYEWLISQYNWHGIKDHIQHDYYISRGYSQGDAVYIVSIDKPIDKPMKKYVDNILWACPINIRAEINGAEFYEDSFLADDYYSYDVDAIKARIAELDISAYAKQWLSDNLPAEPKYL